MALKTAMKLGMERSCAAKIFDFAAMSFSFSFWFIGSILLLLGLLAAVHLTHGDVKLL